jgi:integrase
MPLSSQMIRILAYARLEWRRAGHRRSRWCFPSLRSASGAFTSHRPEAKGKSVPAGHTLRHTWTNIAWAAGVAEQDRSVLLNHALRGETLRYSDPAVMLPYFGPAQQTISDRIERALTAAQK